MKALNMKIIAERTSKNFLQYATIEMFSADAYGLGEESFTKVTLNKINARAQEIAELYNLVVKNHNALAQGNALTKENTLDYYLQKAILENLDNELIYMPFLNSYSPEGVFRLVELAKEALEQE